MSVALNKKAQGLEGQMLPLEAVGVGGREAFVHSWKMDVCLMAAAV